MTTLIVGCGYLGRRVGRRLVLRGETVFGTCRNQARGEELTAIGIEPVLADVADPDTLDGMPPFDRVLFCVGYDRTAGRSMREIYVDGLQRFLDRCPTTIERFVYASSTGVYGQTDGDWIDETSAVVPSGESGEVVLEAERRIREWDRAGVSVLVRYVGLYGPGRVIGRKAIERGDPISGSPDRWLNLIHIDDAAAIADTLLFHPGDSLKPLYLAADDRPVLRGEYYGLVARTLGAPSPRFIGDSPRGESNKRVSNRRIKADLGISLRHPDILTGVPASCELPPNHGIVLAP